MPLVKMDAQKSAGGGGITDWLAPTYSNSNQTVEWNWDFDAEMAVLVGENGAYKMMFWLDLSSGNAVRWLPPTSSASATSLTSMGYTNIVRTPRKLSLTYIGAAFADFYLIPLESKSQYTYIGGQ